MPSDGAPSAIAQRHCINRLSADMIRKLTEDVLRSTHHSPKQGVKDDGHFVWRRRQLKERPIEPTSSKNLGPRSHPRRWRPPPPLPKEPHPPPTAPPPPPQQQQQQQQQTSLPLPTHTPRQKTSQPPPPPTPPPLHLRAKLSRSRESDIYPSRVQPAVVNEESSLSTSWERSPPLSLGSIADLESLGQGATLLTTAEEQEEHGEETSIPAIAMHCIPSSLPKSQQITELQDAHSEQQAEDTSALLTAQTMYQKQVLLVLKEDLYEKQRHGKVLHHYYSTSTTGVPEMYHSIPHDSRQWVLSTERSLRALVSTQEKESTDTIETITARQHFISRRLRELERRLVAARISKLTARISLQRLRVEQKHAEEALRDMRILIGKGKDAELKWHYLQLIEQNRHRRELASAHSLPYIDSELRLIYGELITAAARKKVDIMMRKIEKELGLSSFFSLRVLYLRAKVWRLAKNWQPDSSEVHNALVLEAWRSEARRLYSFSQSLDLLLRRASQKQFVAKASATAEGQRNHRRLAAALVADEVDIMKCRSSCGLASQSAAVWP